MIHSPSKFTSIDRLKQIKQDNYIGELGKEYAACEVDMLIIEKMQRASEKLKGQDYRNKFKPEVKVNQMDVFLKELQKEWSHSYSQIKLGVVL